MIVCQGRKRGYLGDQLYLYDEHHYLAVSVPVPFSMETDATPERLLLALYLHLDFTLAAELALQIDRECVMERVQAPQSIMSTMQLHCCSPMFGVTGIRKASIHHHFPSKVDLVVAVVNQARSAIQAQIAALENGTPVAMEQLAGYTGYWERCIPDQTAPFCLAGVLAAELPGLPPAAIGAM